MPCKFFKNFILCGDVDYHCLLCQENFQALTDVEKHMRWENHRKAVKSQTRSPRFKKDHVFKVGEKFYCEVCNWVAADIETMTDHIIEKSHLTHKKKPIPEEAVTQTICKRESGYFLISDLIVPSRNWHCIVENECAVCGVEEIKNVVQHIHTTDHVLNLIASKVAMEDYGICYRKMCNNQFYCFICNRKLPMLLIPSHWSDIDHCENSTSIYRVTVASKENQKLELTRRLILGQRNKYFINLKDGKATCKICNTDFSLDIKTLILHQKEHKDVDVATPRIFVDSPSSGDETEEVKFAEVPDHGKRRSELSKYGKEHHIKLNPGGGLGYCSLCHTFLSGHLRYFKQHVKGSRHKGFLELKGIEKPINHILPELKTQLMTDFLLVIFYGRPVHIMWVNKEYCIDVHSFLLFSNVDKNPHRRITKCYVCDEFFPRGHDIKHFNTETHKKNFLRVPVIVVKGEFVREVLPDVYHCGCCNKVFPFWDVTEKHLKSAEHKQKKNDKELLLRVAQECLDDGESSITSKHPDILYIQILSLGMMKKVPIRY